MTDSSARDSAGKSVVVPPVGASGALGGEKSSALLEAAAGVEDHVSEMMVRLRLTAVVLEDGADDFPVHSRWALVGKVLSPTTLHINTISSALRPTWGNPRGLVFNPAGDNLFVAEFGTKSDKDRAVNGPPWVVGTRAVLLQDFNVDLRPRDMVFNSLKVCARIINLPFGYMHKRWGAMIASSLGIEGSVPVVDADDTGRCWGGYMRVRVEVDVNKPLRRGVMVFSQRRNDTDWFNVQYEHLPHFCFSCGILGHSSLECKNQGERDENGKLPYSGDRLCVPDERKKKTQGAGSSSGSFSAGQGRASSQPSSEKHGQSANKGGAARQSGKHDETPEVSSPAKKRQPRARAVSKTGKGPIKGKNPVAEDGGKLMGKKRKPQQEYRVRTPPPVEVEVANQLAVVAHQGPSAQSAEGLSDRKEASTDSNKKLKGGCFGSADQAGVVEQPRQTQ